MSMETPRTEDLMIIDDDEPFRGRLGRAMEKRGYAVRLAGSFREGLEMAALQPMPITGTVPAASRCARWYACCARPTATGADTNCSGSCPSASLVDALA